MRSNKLHISFMFLAMWTSMVTSQLAGITTAEDASPSMNATETNPISSSSPDSTTELATSSGGVSSVHEFVSSSTPDQRSTTGATIPDVQPEADSSGLDHSTSVTSSLLTSAATQSSTESASSAVNPRTSLEVTDTTEASSEVTAAAEDTQELSTSTENQYVETTTSAESTEDFTLSTVTVETTSDVDSTTLTTEVSTITETDSTTYESTTEPESTTYPTTIISTMIDVASSKVSSMTTGKPASSTESSSEEPETTDSTADLPSPEGNKESCFGQAEVNTAMIVAIVVSVNVITIAVTAFCVHRLVSRRLSWDPPPMNFNKQRAAVSLPRPAPRTGIHLATDNECRSGESPATQIPIVITNEDGWCVPYSEQDQKKKAANGTEDTGV